MTTKRIRNANNANGAIEITDAGVVQISDKTDSTKKLVLDASLVPTGTSVTLATSQNMQDGAADKASYYFPSASNLITLPLSTQLLPGTGDSTTITTCRTSHNAADQLIFVISADGSNTMALTRKANDTLVFQHGGASNITTTSSISDKIITAALTRSSITGTQAYLNGVKDSFNVTPGIATGVPQIASVGYTTTAMIGGNIYRHLQFNYALPADKIARYSAGAKLDYEDVGGSIAIINSVTADQDFSSNTGYWNLGSGVSIGSGVCTYNTATDSISISRANIVKNGKRYRIKFDVTARTSGGVGIHSSQGMVTKTRFNSTIGGALSDITTTNAATAIGTWEFEFTQTGGSDLYVSAIASAVMSIDNLTIIQLGAVLDLEPENITDQTWFDASPNGLHGTVTGALANRFIPRYSSRNYIIGGSFDFCQRYGTSAHSLVANVPAYTVDRFSLYSVGATTTGQIIAATNTTPALYQITGAAGNTLIFCKHRIEATNCANLGGKVVTFALDLANSLTTAVTWIIRRANSYDNFAGITDIKSSTFTVNSTLNRYSTTLTLPAEAVYGLEIEFYVSTQTSGTWKIARVMLNEGPVAAPFERAGGTIGGELALCQRYYENSFSTNVVPSDANITTTANSILLSKVGTLCYGAQKFKVPKRVYPVAGNIKYYNNLGGTAGQWTVYDASGGTAALVPSLAGANTTELSIQVTSSVGVFAYGGWAVDVEI